MTDRQIYEHYITCIAAATAAYLLAGHIAAPIAFIAAAAIQTHRREHRQNP